MKMKQLVFLVAILSQLSACAQSQVNNKAFDLMLNGLLSHTVEEAAVKDLVEENQAVIYLDAREKAEFDVSHINNAIWVGYDDFDLTRVKEVNVSEPIIVYCSVGYRSEKIAEQLLAAGYKDVRNLVGGIFEWSNQDQEVVNPHGEITDSIHAFDANWGIWLRKGVKVYK